MAVPRLVTDVVIGGLWTASAVEVAGYTWAAVSSTWSALPAPGSTGGGTGSGTSPSSVADSLIKDLTGINLKSKFWTGHGLLGLHGPITKAIENFFGSGNSIANLIPGSAKSTLKRGSQFPNHGLGPVGK
jgi:hypothetical protein